MGNPSKDNPPHDTRSSTVEPIPRGLEAGSAVEPGINEILNDPTLSIDEKRALLENRLGNDRADEEADRSAFEPIEAQIFDALAMLAEGGHPYRSPETSDPIDTTAEIEDGSLVSPRGRS